MIVEKSPKREFLFKDSLGSIIGTCIVYDAEFAQVMEDIEVLYDLLCEDDGRYHRVVAELRDEMAISFERG